MTAVGAALSATFAQLLAVLGPIAGLAVLLHVIERVLSDRLVSRLGWRGVLVTGWLGVPIHELSHVGACLLFRHRVERVQLFAPDRRTGRLGSVQHAWNRKSVYQQLGRFFIGIAPLVGGAAALWGVTAWLGPAVITLPDAPPGGGVLEVATATAEQAAAMLRALVRPESLQSGRTWLYLYLCLCIGAHLAPSGADLKGGLPGFVLLCMLLVLVNFVAQAWGPDGSSAAAGGVGGVGGAGGGWDGTARILAATMPVVALLTLAVVLGAASIGMTWVVTAPLPERRL